MRYDQGAWLHGTLYPQRCDLSPDGRLFAYFALKGSARWKPGWTYVAISKLPWLTALAAWGTGGTWTRGIHFDGDPSVWRVADPDEGTLAPLRGRIGLAVTMPASYAVERRRGWVEAEGTAPRGERDLWDEQRAEAIRMEKPRPGDGGMRLEVTGSYAAFRSLGPQRGSAVYAVLGPKGRILLSDAQWADWDPDGRLLVATVEGCLEVRVAGDWSSPGVVVADLSELAPAREPPPPEAARW